MILAGFLWLIGLPIRAEIVLLENGENPIPIFFPPPATESAAQPPGKRAAQPEQVAAKQLATYLQKISGKTFTVSVAPNPLPERGIFVGAADPLLTTGLEPDDFVIKTDKQRIHLTSGSRRTALYPVFAFLEEALGCRWWSWNEEDVPSNQTTLRIPDLNVTHKAAFAIHNPWNQEAGSTQNQFLYKARTTSSESFSGGHTLYPLLTPYATEHPDIFPMDKKGNRKHNKLHFCYTAPDIAQALADALAAQVEARKGDVKGTIYFAGMGDWYGGMCECPTCKKIYEEETWTDPDGRKKAGYTATLLQMMNKTAEILEKKYPGIRVGTFAYMSIEAPPAKTVPRSNVVIRVPRLRHCTVHAAETCPKNRSYLRNIERWCELAPGRVYIWEYGASFKNFLTPFPCLHSMADNLKLYHKLGIRGVEIQGNYVSTGGDLAVLKNHVWSKIFWDPTLDTRVVLQDFCKGYYGPAATNMLAYVETVEKSVREPKSVCADEFAKFGYLTAEVRQELGALRAQAIAAAADKEPFLRRVKEATVGLEALALWQAGPLEEQDGKLIRKDLGGYSFDRAKDLVDHLRGSGATEWSSGPAAQMGFLTWHGGPLVTLSRGPLEVKIAPVLNGQIRQISYLGKPLLEVASPKTKGYPLVGGSIARAGTRMMSLVSAPTPNQVIIEGGGGVGLFGGRAKQTIRETMELTDDGSLLTTGTVQALAGSDDKHAATVSTVYAYGTGKNPPAPRVSYLTGDNAWKEAELPTGTNACVLPPLLTLRIDLPEKGCTVLDQYGPAGARSARLTVDGKQHTLNATLGTVPVEISQKREDVFMTRKIQVVPLMEPGATPSPSLPSTPAATAPKPSAPAAPKPSPVGSPPAENQPADDEPSADDGKPTDNEAMKFNPEGDLDRLQPVEGSPKEK